MKIVFGRGKKLFVATFAICLATAALVISLGMPGLFQGDLRRGDSRQPASVPAIVGRHNGPAPQLSVQAPPAPRPAPNSPSSASLVILPGPPSAAKTSSLLMQAPNPPAPKPPPQLSKPRISTALVPINFQPNRGQAAGDVRFIARAPGYDVHLQDRALTFNLFSSPSMPARATTVGLELLGASQHPLLSAVGELPGKANYLRSSDPATWITGVPTYAGVLYRNVYRGIDVVFHGAGNRLEYDFTVAPGADASQIAWRFNTSAVTLTDSGDLVLQAGGAELRFMKPVIYQSDQNGRQYVTGSYHLQPSDGGAIVRFDLGAYDHRRALVIDPVLSYSVSTGAYGYIGSMAADSAGNAYLTSASGILQVTKLATDGATMLYQTSIGSGYSASAAGVAVDNARNLYITGTTGPGFPTTSTAYQPVSGSGAHAYLTVLDPTGSTLVYSTYLQGSNVDSAVTVALDNSGAHPLPVIAGFTYSTDFPNTSGVTLNGNQTAFVAKFDPTLSGVASLLYSTVVPATYSSFTQGVAADGSGNIYALVQAQTLTTTPGAFTYDGVYVGYGGVYVVKLNVAGASQYVAYLGYGNAADIAADTSGNAYVVGDPLYADFPATTGAYQTTFPFGFLSVLNPSGSALVYSTFLSGPSGNVTPTSVAIPAGCASACNVYVGGFTTANDFPTTANAIQKTLGGASDAFIVEVSGDGSSALFSSYLGGTYDENIDASYYYYYYYYYSQRMPKVSLDGGATPNIFIAGNTNSTNFPYTGPGSNSGYLTKISPTNAGIVIPDQYKINFPAQTISVASAPVTLNLRNYGSATVILSTLTTTPGFAQTNSCGGSIAGGSSCALQLTYTPTYPGQLSGSLTINHDGTNNPTTIALTGYGADQPLVGVTPTALHFGTQAVNTSSSTQVVTVTSMGTQPATIGFIYFYSGQPDFSQTNNCPASLLPGASCSVAVTFSPLTVGYFSSYLYIQTNSANTSYFYLSLDGTSSGGTGIGPAALTLSTTAVNFIDQAVGANSGTQYVTVYNTGTVPVTFGTPSIAGANPADFSLSYNTCPLYAVVPGSSCTIGLIFKPTATGTRSGTLTLPNSAGAAVPVALAGNGVSAVGSLLFSPAAMVFPDTAVGSTSGTQSITVTNQGTTAVTIDRVFDSGNDFRVTNTGCITVLPPNGSTCTIDVTFTPGTTGPITGTVTLVDDAPGSPQTIGLSGNGVTAVETLVASPSSVGFDDTVLGSSTYTAVNLYNPGNSDITISKLATSLPDFTASGCPTVPAFSYCTIYVYFTPTIAGPRSGTLTITDTAPLSPHKVPLSGNGLAAVNSLEITPLIVGFPDTVLGVASGGQAVTLYNPGTANITVTSPPTASGDFSVTNYCGTIYAGSYCTDYVVFTPTLAGQRTGTLSIMDTAPNSPHTATLIGNGINPFLEVVATPSSLGFQDQVVGTTSSYSPIYFFNPGNADVGVSNVAINGDFAIYSNGCSTRVPAQSYCVEYVTFSPSGSGPRTGTLTITDTAAGSPHGVSLYGNGLAASASLTLTPSTMDFGNVLTATTSPAQALYLTNTGTQPVVVTSVTPSNFFQGSGCVGTISAGTQCGISVTYTGSGTVAQIGNITVLDSSTGIAHAVQLTGTPTSTAPAVSISPNGLTFVQTVVGKTSSALSANFVNNSGAAVAVSSASPSPGDFAVNSNNCSSVPNGSSCAVSVNFTPTASGVRTATLTFTHNGPGGTIAINLSGYARPATTELQLSASALSFPDQVVGTSSGTQLVYLWNQGTVPVSVSGNISISPADFAISSTSCNSANIQPASYCYAYVYFQPASATTITGALTINTISDPASPHVVTLTGNGVSPVKNLAFSATSVQFPDQPVGFPSSQQYLTLYNSGNTNVTVASVTPNGDFAVASNGCATVYARSYCYLYLTFTPSQTGLRSGSLDIADDATGNPHSIALSGNGITATKALTLTATSLAFADQPVGTASNNQYLYVYNTGSAPVTFTPITTNGDFGVINYSSCQSGSVSPGSYCYVYVFFQPTVTGTRTGSLTIHSSAGDYPVSLTGNGVAVVHAARVGATALTFTDQAIGTTSTYQLLALYNTGNVPLNVSSVNITGDFGNPYSYTCNPAVVSVNSYCYVYLTFTPTATGLRTGTVTITDDSAAGTHTVALSGNGVTPTKTVTLIPGNLQFLPQTVGTATSYQYVTVVNTGNFPVTITGANVTDTIAGSGFGLYTNGCSTLQNFGNQCNVYVTVTPTISGPLSGTLTITDNTTAGTHSIALAGTGVASNQAVQLSQTSLTFANQPVGTTSPVQVVYFVNQSTTAVNITNFVVSGDYQVSGCGTGSYIYSTSSCSFSISFKPTGTGARPGSITINDTGASSPRTITLNGTGVNPFPVATLSNNNLVFGSQNIGSNSAYQYFNLSNTGSAALNISSIAFAPATADYALTPTGSCGATLAVSASCYIYVTFTPSNLSGPGTRSATLVLTDNDPSGSQSVNITGNALAASPLVSLSPTSVLFGNQAVNVPSLPQTVTLTNQGNAALTITSVTASSPFAVATNNCPATVNALANCTITLTFTPTASGAQNGTLTITDSAAGNPHIVGLSGTGVGSPSIALNPASLIFSNQQVGIASTQQSIVISNSGSPMLISSIGISAGDFAQTNNCSIAPSPLGTNGSCSIGVIFNPTAIGTRSATITINDNAGAGQQTVPVSGTGIGLPVVTLSPTTLTFANQNVGTSSTSQPVTLTNTGGGPLAINSIQPSAGYAQTNNCGNNLDAGASCTINVSFVPTIIGTQAGSVSISDSAAGSPHSISTTGVGLGAQPAFSPTSLAFGAVAVGTPTTAPAVTLSNTGNVTMNITNFQINDPPYSQTNNCPSTLAPNASCTVTVVFNPTAAATQNGTLYVFTNGINGGTGVLNLTGSGFGPVAGVSPASLNFGSVTIGAASPAQTITLSSTGSTALTITNISFSGVGDYSQTNTCPATLASASNCSISVTFTPGGVGTRNGALLIYDNTAASPHQVPLSGIGLGPAVTFNPPSLNFGTISLGTTSSSLPLTLTNSGTNALLISANGITASSEFAQTNNCPSALAAAVSCTISVTFTPASAGTRNGSITVLSNAGTQTASLTGVGNGPQVQLSPSSLSFGSLPLGLTSAPQSVVFTNSGNAALTITSIVPSTDFAETDNCTATLGAGSFCTLTVTFKPSAIAPETGAITITDSAGGSPHKVILSGTGTGALTDLAVTGTVIPATIPPGGSFTYTFVVTNGGPSPATGVAFNITLPSAANATLNSVNTTAGTCTGTGPLACNIGKLASGSAATVTIAMTATAVASFPATGTASGNETDPSNTNNSLTLTSSVQAADLVVIGASAPTTVGGTPAYSMMVTNNGPSSASNVSMTCAYDRYQYLGYSTPYGTCTYSGATLTCSLGPLAVGASTGVTQQVQPPNTGWASITCHASADQFDPNPVNNSAQISPPADSFNTSNGNNVAVQLADVPSGTLARVTFSKVTQPGTTSLTRTAGATAPASFRSGAQPATFDLSTSALYNPPLTVSLGFSPAQFHKPAQVHLFHMEGGAWVDRTVAMDPSTYTVSALTSSLSPFALFEPVNHPPTANAGADRTVSGTSVVGAPVVLDGSSSADPDSDSLTYRWTGPFPEGNGVATGAKPSVTLPLGASKVMLVVNDGEADSAPAAINVAVSDFAVALSQGSASLKRGQSTALNVNITSKGGSFDQSVMLGCANLPASMTCQFSPPSVQPGASGANTVLTLTSSGLAQGRRAPRPLWAMWTGLFGVLGIVVVGARRGRGWGLLLIVLVLTAIFYTGCGGGGISAPQNNVTPSTTVTITITGSSGGLQHSATATVTMN
jgi:hypothetical protein